MVLSGDAHAFLHRWASAIQGRDVERNADLYLRDGPLVTFSDGERASDWVDVRVRLKRDLERVVIERVEIHDVVFRELAPDLANVSFVYELHLRDVWGMPAVATRLATMTLADTKDGLRIAAGHFSAT